jgi:hypothetical protein
MEEEIVKEYKNDLEDFKSKIKKLGYEITDLKEGKIPILNERFGIKYDKIIAELYILITPNVTQHLNFKVTINGYGVFKQENLITLDDSKPIFLLDLMQYYGLLKKLKKKIE